MISNFDEVMLY